MDLDFSHVDSDMDFETFAVQLVHAIPIRLATRHERELVHLKDEVRRLRLELDRQRRRPSGEGLLVSQSASCNSSRCVLVPPAPQTVVAPELAGEVEKPEHGGALLPEALRAGDLENERGNPSLRINVQGKFPLSVTPTVPSITSPHLLSVMPHPSAVEYPPNVPGTLSPELDVTNIGNNPRASSKSILRASDYSSPRGHSMRVQWGTPAASSDPQTTPFSEDETHHNASTGVGAVVAIEPSNTDAGTSSPSQSISWHSSMQKKNFSERLKCATKSLEDYDRDTIEGPFGLRRAWLMSDAEMQAIRIHASEKDLEFHIDFSESQVIVHDVRETLMDSFVIQPQSRFKLSWDMLGVLALSYDVVLIPLQVFNLPEIIALSVVEWLCVLYWTFDIIVSCFTGVYVRGVLETRLPEIRRRYARTWLPLDLIVVLSEWVSQVIIANSTSNAGILRVLRSGRAARLVRLFKLIRIIKFAGIVAELRKNMISSPNATLLFTLLRLVSGCFGLIHVLACIWYWTGNTPGGWVRVEGLTSASVGDQYLYSFLFALARSQPTSMSDNLKLGTLGEKVLSILATFVCISAASLFLSTVTTAMTEQRRATLVGRQRLQAVHEYIQEYNISHNLAQRLRKLVEVDERAAACQREAILADLLPKKMMVDLRFEAYSPLISVHWFFRLLAEKHERTKADICFNALVELTPFGMDVVFMKGDACEQMLFITFGRFVYTLGGSLKGTRRSHVKRSSMASVAVSDAATSVLSAASSFVGRQSHRGSVTLQTANVDVCTKLKPVTTLPGKWLSEAALWTPWENCGELLATQDSKVIAMREDKFLDAVQRHSLAKVEVVLYARCFVQELNDEPFALRTDLRLDSPSIRDTNARKSFSRASRISGLSGVSLATDSSASRKGDVPKHG